LPANQFTATGYGSTQPVASNDTDEGKAQNRRIDFLVR
jgi:OOP family OmpA-OmpF porin